MKVVVIASLAYSLVNFRAALLRAMVEQGHQVLACAPDEDPEVVAALSAMGVQFRRIPMDRTGVNPVRDLETLAALVRLLRRERPDLVLAYTQKPIVYGGIATRLALRRAEFYAMVSGLGHAFSEGGGRKRALLRALLSLLYRIAVARARSVFVFNDCDAAEMRARRILGPRHRVVQVAGSGIDVAAFARRPVPEGGPVFLLVARMLRDKGIVEFIEAAKIVRSRCPSARFQLLGSLDPNPSGFTRDELQHYLDGSGIDYLGETRDVRPYLAAANVFVLPSYYREGLPRTILEAMATGRAVITTDMPGCRETVIRNFNGFLVPPRDVTALAAAMSRFAQEPALAARMGKRSRWFAERRFDVRRVNATLLGTMFHDDSRQPATAFRPRRAIADLRILELALAGLLGLFLFPLALLTALIVAIGMGRPVLLVQKRAGKAGEVFPLIKFRTMRDLRDESGKLLPDAERLTGLGRLLRRSRLDELPEICNVLRGEMALIGPRPLLPETIEAMSTEGLRRGAIRPGLTGWAQVNGNTLLSQREKLALDLWYIAHRSIGLDLRIIGRTLLMLIAGERVNGRHIGRAYAGAADRRG